MQTIDEETLRWNRRNAVVFGIVSIVFLQVVIFTVLKLVPKDQDPGYPLLVSVLAYIVAAFLVGRIWIKWRRNQRAKERGLDS